MTLKRCAFLLSCVSFLTWSGVKADSQGFRLVREGGTDQINPIDEQLHRQMDWSHGAYMLQDVLGGQSPVFYSLDRAGTWTDTAKFQNPESSTFNIFSHDRQSNGTIVFSGQTVSEYGDLLPFLAWTSADGQIQRLIRTEHYFPYQVAVAPDDTIWTLGYEFINRSVDDPAVNKEAKALRHFDKTGNLIGSAFPQSQFTHRDEFAIGNGLLVAAQDRLGWYGPGMVKQSIGRFRSTRWQCESTRASTAALQNLSLPQGWRLRMAASPQCVFRTTHPVREPTSFLIEPLPGGCRSAYLPWAD